MWWLRRFRDWVLVWVWKRLNPNPVIWDWTDYGNHIPVCQGSSYTDEKCSPIGPRCEEGIALWDKKERVR